MRFSFTGNIRINDETTRNPSVRCGNTKNGGKYVSGGFGVNNDGSSAWVEGFSMEDSSIKTVDANNSPIEIEWEDRMDPEVINTVANYRKFTIVDDSDRTTYLSFADFIKDLSDRNVNGRKATVTGTTQVNVYQGNISQRFQVQNIYFVDNDTKNKLQLVDTLYFTKDSFDTADWASEHKLIINGWISAFIDKATLGAAKGANKYIPFSIIFDCSKINWDNEKHIALVKYKLKQIGCDLVDGKIKVNLKKNVYKMSVVLSYINGAEQVEFDESMLSANQREAIELGLKTLDDFKSRVYGDRVTMYKLTDFDLRGDYEDGYVDCDITEDELDIFVPDKDETLDEVINNVSSKVEEDEDDIDGLFN